MDSCSSLSLCTWALSLLGGPPPPTMICGSLDATAQSAHMFVADGGDHGCLEEQCANWNTYCWFLVRVAGFWSLWITGRLGFQRRFHVVLESSRISGNLYAANLTGELPREIGDCSALEELSMSQNNISGEIPSELSLLKNLKYVYRWQNKLSGSIPESLGNCSGLIEINFSLKTVTGEIPPSLADLSALEKLFLSVNNISGEIPAFLGNLSSLKQLKLNDN
ncbi:unnamed protein product [Camellia sinensis]